MKQGFDSILGSNTFKMLKDSVLCCGHPYVEIGGIKWATMNIGAEKETDLGLYFQWGDTQGYTVEQVGKGEGHWENYKYGNGSVFNKYNNTDGLTTLETTDDAATAAWGGSWRMPTVSEFTALRAAVTAQWVTDYQGSGVNGMVLTDKADSSKVLFFPACGLANANNILFIGEIGVYWSNSLKNNNDYNSYGFSFDSCGIHWQGSYFRYGCFAVRGVLGE